MYTRLKTLVSLVLCTGGLVFSSVGASEAQDDADERARVHYQAGTLYFESERYEEALEEFREAYRLSRRPLLLYNQASALDQLGRATEAIALYRVFLDSAPDTDMRGAIEERMAELEGALSAPSSEEPTPPAERAPVEPLPSTRAPTDSGPRVGALVALIAAGALTAGAITTGLMAQGVHDDLAIECGENAACDPTMTEEIDRGERLALITDILGVSALLAASAGFTLWLLQSEDPEQTMRVSLSPTQVELEVSF